MSEIPSKCIVRALHDFSSDLENELNFKTGDIIQVIERIDKHWLLGCLNQKSGNFPATFVIEVPLPTSLEQFKEIFVSLESYQGQEGDLCFSKGQIILGLEAINQDWWKGRLIETNSEGLFPLNHVWKLNKSYLPLQKHLNQHDESQFHYAIVTSDLLPLLPDEIALKKGDRVKIFCDHDKMYYKGENNGKVGILPKRFVNIENSGPLTQPASQFQYSNTTNSKPTPISSLQQPSTYVSHTIDFSNDTPPAYQDCFTSDSHHLINNEIQSYVHVLYTFTAEAENELSIKEGDIVHLIRHVNDKWLEGELDGKVGMFPKDFVQIIQDVVEENNTEPAPVSEQFAPDSYGRILYDFSAQLDGDLTVKKGMLVTLLRKLNQDWIEALDDSGKSGIIPLSFVEIIGETSNTSPVPTKPDSNLIQLVFDAPDQDLLTPSLSHPFTQPNSDNLPEQKQVKHKPNMLTFSNDDRSTSQASNITLPVSNHCYPNLTSTIGAIDNQNSNRSTRKLSQNASTSNIQIPKLQKEEQRLKSQKKKTLEQRSCIITELLQSERDYCKDLKVCMSTFLDDINIRNQLMNHNVDIEPLFSNLSDIIKVSTKLARSLEDSTRFEKPESQMIGRCFLNLEQEMKQAYLIYCRDHEEVPIVWEKYEENPEVKAILYKGLEKIKAETNCFDVPGILIKPVQRILKYPLLVNELVKCTDDSHPDKPDLLTATRIITEMAKSINEVKRRKDLVFKYRKETNSSFSSKISKLNLHTMKKKSSRLGFRISTTFGLSAITKDESFDNEMNKFKVIEKTIKIFLKDLNMFTQAMSEFVNTSFQLSESIAVYYADRSKQQDVDQYRSSQRLLLTDYWDEMKKSLEVNVVSFLRQLLSKFHGPSKLIDKRRDKLLDFVATTKRLESNKDMFKTKALKEEQSLAQNNYEALNRQLLDDLPKFSSIAMSIFHEAICAFIKTKLLFLYKVTNQMIALLELPSLIGSSSINSSSLINETFQVKYNLIVDQIISDFSIIPAHIFPCASFNSISASLDRRGSKRSLRKASSVSNTSSKSSSASKNVIQSPNQKVFLKNKYTKNAYQVTQNFEAADILEISVQEGDIVGIIKYKDPSGNSYRWFVDNGHAKGFLPSSILSSLYPNNHSNSSIHHPSLVTFPQPHTQSNQTVLSSNLNSHLSQLNIHYDQPHSVPAPLLPPPLAPAPTPTLKPTSTLALAPLPPPRPAPPRPVNTTSHSFNVNEKPPPRYDMVAGDEPHDNNLLIGVDRIEETQSSKGYLNISEFDPLASQNGGGLNHGDSDSETDDDLCRDDPPVNETYYAAYPFNSYGEHQLSLKQGSMVLVKYKCDLNSNHEWWLVQDQFGQKGYVPGNYLKPYS